MTDKEIIEMWEKVIKYAPSEVRITEFAKLVAQHEREECAKLIEEMPCDCCWPEDSISVAVDFADAIRTRGENV